MARNISISFSLTAALTDGFKGAFQSAASSARNVASAIRDMEKTPVGHLGSAMAQQREKIKGLAGSLKEAKATLATLQSQAQASGGATGMLARQIELAQSRVNNLNGAMQRQLGIWRNTTAQAATTGGSIRRLSQEYDHLSQRIERARRVQAAMAANRAQADALRSQRADLNSRLMSTAATTMSMALPVKLAISAEDTFADLKKVMDAPQEVMTQVFADAQEMSNRTGKSFEDVVSIMTAAAQAGLGKTREELLGVAEQAVKMSIAWGVSAEDAGKSLANWRASMGLTTDEANHMGDVINALSNEMNAEAGEINAIFTRMGAMMKGSGVAAQDIAALATAFKAAGADVSVAGTAMKNFTAVLAGGSLGLSDNQLPLMGLLKIDPDELQKEFYADSQKAIIRVLEALKNNVKPEEMGSVAMKLFGKESIAAISPLIAQLDQLKKAYEIANSNVDNSVNDEYANRMKTSATAISQMTQSVRNLGVNFGTALLPAVTVVSQGIAKFAQTLSDMTQQFPKLTTAITGVGAGIAIFAAVSLALGLILNTVRTGLNGFRGGLLRLSAAHVAATASTTASTAAAGGFGIASRIAGAGAKFFAGGLRSILMATGVGALLVGLGFAINLLIDNWDAVVAAMSTAWNSVKDTWSRLGVFFSELGKNLAAIFTPIWDRICQAATLARDLIIDCWNGLSAFFTGLWNGISTAAQVVWDGISAVFTFAYDLVTGYWNGLLEFYAGLWNGVCAIATGVWNSICGVFTWAYDTVTGIWTGISEFFGGVGDSISGVFSGVWLDIENLAIGAWEGIAGIWNGAVNFFGGIVDSIFGVFTGLFAWLKERFAWVFSTVDAVGSVIGSITGAVKGAWNAAFGDDENKAGGEKSAAPAADKAQKDADRKKAENVGAALATATVAQKPASTAPAAQNALDTSKDAGGNSPATPKYQPVSADAYHAAFESKKDGTKGGKKSSGGGSRSRSGAAGGGGRSRSGAASGSESGIGAGFSPVTVVTLDSGNKIKTQFFPAAGRTAKPLPAQQAHGIGVPLAGNAANALNAGTGKAAAQSVAGAVKRPVTHVSQQDNGFMDTAMGALKSTVNGIGRWLGVDKAKSVLAPGQPALPQAPGMIARKQGQKAKEQQPG